MNILPKKFIISPVGKKIVKKFPHIFHFQKWKIFQNCTFLGKIVKISIFGEKLQKFANLGVKIEKKNRVKTIVICIFWG